MFREPPRVELGPLSVGLAEAAARATARLPRGGRVLGRRRGAVTPQTLGTLGSAGLVVVASVAFVTMTSDWQPASWPGRVAVALFVLFGGASLALLMRAVDRVADAPILRADVVGRATRRTVLRMTRLAAQAERAPHDFGARRVAALRRAIAATRDPDLAPWIPRDLIGRAELLLARMVALQAGARWTCHRTRRADVRDLLVRAGRHLDDPSAAMADLEAMGEDLAALTRRATTGNRRSERSAGNGDAADGETVGELAAEIWPDGEPLDPERIFARRVA